MRLARGRDARASGIGRLGRLRRHSPAADIATHPEDYYVNVHNAEFPGGAVRGQLS